MAQILFSLIQVLGFFDADGSFEAKVYLGTQKPISFHVNFIFSQKNANMLHAVIASTNATNSKGQSTKKVSPRNIQNQSGTTSIGNSISLAFSSSGGQTLLNFLAQNNPKAPTKFLDYKIALILAEVSSPGGTALGVVKKHLNPSSPVFPKDELTAGLALLWLRYRMFGKVKENKNPKLTPIEEHYEKTGATLAQINQSIEIGKQLFEPIDNAFQAHCAWLENSTSQSSYICEDYLLGYHMGDGSFYLGTVFSNGTFKGRFSWTLTDCIQNKPLLMAIQRYLSTKGISAETLKDNKNKTYSRLMLSNRGGCLALVGLWKGKPLLGARLNQYSCFVKALNLYDLERFKCDLSLAEEFINLKWVMNPDTNSKTGDLATDLSKIREWFSKNKKD